MITVKIHNVYHEPTGGGLRGSLSDEIVDRVVGVEDVRIAKGYRNSPIFIAFSEKPATLKRVKRKCRHVLQCLSKELPGLKIDTAIQDHNIRIIGYTNTGKVYKAYLRVSSNNSDKTKDRYVKYFGTKEEASRYLSKQADDVLLLSDFEEFQDGWYHAETTETSNGHTHNAWATINEIDIK